MTHEPRFRRQPTGTGPVQALQAARRAAGVMLFLLALLWMIEIVDTTHGHTLDIRGITPRDPDELPDILTAPFLHASFDHLAANSLPLFVLGFLTAVRGIGRFVLISVIIVAVSGIGVWLVAAPDTVHLGVSGVIFGYFGYLVERGLLDRRIRDILIGVAVVGVYGLAVLSGVLPGQEGVSWEAHFFGLVGGGLAAWMFRLQPGGSRAARPLAELRVLSRGAEPPAKR